MDELFEIRRRENTDTMIKNFFRHIFESLKSLKRNGWMSIASISAVTITLILVGMSLSVIWNVTNFAKNVENDVDIAVYIQIGTTEAEVEALRHELQALPNVENVEFSSKVDQYNELVEKFGDEWKIFEEDENPLYDVYIVKAQDPKHVTDIHNQVQNLPYVERADYGGTSSDKIFKFAEVVKRWGLLGSVVLLIIAIFLISNTIRITILSRKREIQIMKLVGAKNSYIRWPFFIEGAWIGLIGSIIPIIIMTFGYQRIYRITERSILTSSITLISPGELIYKINLIMIGIGVLIGSLGSILSMRRFLKV